MKLKSLSLYDVTTLCDKYKITPLNLIRILYEYTATNRLSIAMPLLKGAWPGRKFKHWELAELVGSSREKIGLALKMMGAGK